MEDLKKDLVAGIAAAVDRVIADPQYRCIYCKAVLEFRIDQLTRREPDTWDATVIVVRDDGWAKMLRSDDSVIGRVCPSCTEEKKPTA